jgi:hypothetical protein
MPPWPKDTHVFGRGLKKSGFVETFRYQIVTVSQRRFLALDKRG